MTHLFPYTHNTRTCHHIALLSSGWQTHPSLSHHHTPLAAQYGHSYPPGCYSPVARLKHRIATAAKPTSWPEPPLAGEDISTSRRKHEVVTLPSNLWSDNEDGQPCWTGPDRFYSAGLPMGSQLSPGLCNCYDLVRAPHHHIPHPTPPPLQLHAIPAFSNCMQPQHSPNQKHLLQNEMLSRNTIVYCSPYLRPHAHVCYHTYSSATYTIRIQECPRNQEKCSKHSSRINSLSANVNT